MRTCDGIFSANLHRSMAGATTRRRKGEGERESNGIFSMTGSPDALAKFFPRARKFSGLPLDNARAASPEKNSMRHEISTEAVENFWIRQA
jgi:hypothetical protein